MHKIPRFDLILYPANDGKETCAVRISRHRDDISNVVKVVKLDTDNADVDIDHLKAYRELLKGRGNFSEFLDSIAEGAFRLGVETAKKK